MSTALHENIRRLRLAAEVSVRGACRSSGLSRAAWIDIEQGRNPNPTPRTLEKIAAAIGCELPDLFVDADGRPVVVGEKSA